MKSGVTLQQMLTEVKRQSESKEDYLIAPNRLRMESYGKEMFLHLSDDSGTELIEPMTITGIAHRQIGTHLRIPAAYYDRMREERPDLLAYNANTWFKQENSQRMLRTLDGSARAYLSNRYRRIDNIDIAGVTLPILGGLPDIRFESCQITESRMYIKAVNPRLQAEVSPGDIVQAGVIISNSEVGLGSVSIQPLIYRLVCSNGMVVNEAAARRNHVGRVTDSGENFSVYSQATLDAEDKAFVMKIQDTVRAAVEEARFAQVVGKMQEAKAAQMDTHDVPAVVKLASKEFHINNDLEVAANVIQLRNSISNILQEAYEDTLAEIESERANLTYSDVVDSVGGHVSYNAFQLISMYCAYQGEDDYTKISLTDLSEQVQAHQTEYYAYTTSEEVRTEPVQKEVRGQTITVQEDHTYTVFALSYVGDDYFADTVWQLDDKQKSYADAYTHNLTVYLHEIEEREGISILGQINDALIDDDSPAPGGGFGNPFNDPNWEQHITSFFGKRKDVGIPGKDTTNHNGLDIAYPYGTPILAVEAGTVIKAGYHVSYGNYLVINHGGGYCTLYAHCSQLLAQVGDTVNKYDTIAKVGATGDVTGNHLHICVIVDGVYVNPKGYLH